MILVLFSGFYDLFSGFGIFFRAYGIFLGIFLGIFPQSNKDYLDLLAPQKRLVLYKFYFLFIINPIFLWQTHYKFYLLNPRNIMTIFQNRSMSSKNHYKPFELIIYKILMKWYSWKKYHTFQSIIGFKIYKLLTTIKPLNVNIDDKIRCFYIQTVFLRKSFWTF